MFSLKFCAHSPLRYAVERTLDFERLQQQSVINSTKVNSDIYPHPHIYLHTPYNSSTSSPKALLLPEDAQSVQITRTVNQCQCNSALPHCVALVGNQSLAVALAELAVVLTHCTHTLTPARSLIH